MSGFISSSPNISRVRSNFLGYKNLLSSSTKQHLVQIPSSSPKATLTSSTSTKSIQHDSQSFDSTKSKTTTTNTSQHQSSSLPKDAIPYFAYFANMNPNKVGPKAQIPLRRCNIFRSDLAFLPGYELTFDVPGIPPEPVFANIIESKNSNIGIHGMIHWVSKKDFDRIALSEGVISSTNLLNSLPIPPGIGAKVKDINVFIQKDQQDERNGIEIVAKTIQFSHNSVRSLVTSSLKPSRRYLQVAIDGAQYWGINQSYVDNVLKSIQYEKGFLGGFGLISEQRPHILDRPNPNDEFGKPLDEIYSPWRPIPDQSAVKKFNSDEDSDNVNLKIVHVSNTDNQSAYKKTPLFFIPGIDGTGKGIVGQVADLDREGYYDVFSIVYPYANRQSIQEMAETIIGLIYDQVGNRSVCITGESMGGAVALQLAIENTMKKSSQTDQRVLDIESLVVVNPASSYERSNPRVLWESLLDLGLSEEWYNFLLPPILLPFVIDMENAMQSIGPQSLSRLRNMLFTLADIAEVLPLNAMGHRVNLLKSIKYTSDDLKILSSQYSPTKIGVISTINDNLIPSYSEKFRLQRLIPDIYSIVLPYGGHVPMLDPMFSLAGLLKPFHASNITTQIPRRTPSDQILKRRQSIKNRHGTNGGNPQASKSMTEIRSLMNRLAKSTRDYAPVFVGEENIPDFDPKAPILFISNHTLLGWFDGMYPIMKLLESKNVLLHSLAHPILLETGNMVPGMETISKEEFADFGVQIVSPRTLLEQLADGKWSLLFPGGARESLKQSYDPPYGLLWPDYAEFIRPCALFGATIIPVSTVGTEDMVRIIANSDVVESGLKFFATLTNQEVPFSDFTTDMVKAWRGKPKDGERNSIAPPLMIPNGNDRLYYRFGKPIHIPEECLHDRELEYKMYYKVKEQVEEGVEILKRRRLNDSFRSLEKRKEFREKFGEFVQPPAGPAWGWEKGNGNYLDEDLQPPIR